MLSNTKRCTKCGLDKPLEAFHKQAQSKDGHRPNCKDCANERNKKYYQKNREKIISWGRVYNQTEHRRLYARKYQAERWRRQKDKRATRSRPLFCECCGSSNKICFDHDHLTGGFRGWLCNRCNRVLGLCEDNPRLMRLLATYLEDGTHGKKHKSSTK